MRDLEPTIRSRELGLALHRAAQAKGLRGTDVAEQLGWSHSRVSRIYSGKRGSHNRDDIIALLAICGITGPKRDELLELSSHAYEEGWWRQYGDRLPPELCTLCDYEDAAIAITNFETAVVPGLLQTPGYMRALMHQTPAIPPEEIELRIEARRNRQRIFNRVNPARFVFYLDEYALLRTGPGGELMSEQLHHLLRMAIRPYVEIRIIPDSAGFHAGRYPFILMRFTEFSPIVHIENQTSVLFLEGKGPISGYRRIVADLDSVALDEQRSREALAILASALGAPREDYDDLAPPVEEEFPQ
jgi:transcriptional regulator with XRE-family HTH domain